MIYRITTKTGSVYEVDDSAMRWRQISTTSRSGMHRSKSGRILELGEIVIGQPLWLRDDNTLPGSNHHFLVTSRVTRVTREQEHPWDCKCEWHV